MAPSGVRKAAVLLASLDPGTAAELLKAARPDLLPEITAELVLLDAAGTANDAIRHIREFCALLGGRQQKTEHKDSFVRQMLDSVVGPQKSDEVFGQVQRLVDMRDPFKPVRSVSAQDLGRALEGEHPQVAALVLLELPPAKSAAIIPLLEEKVRSEAVRRMTVGDTVSQEAKVRVAAMIRSRLDSLRKAETKPGRPAGAARPGAPAATKEQASARLRRVALLLRGLPTELRDSLVKSIAEQSANTGTAVQNLMILWEDLPLIGDRSLQDVLRSVDSRKLALALVKAEAATTARIRENISERARSMIDEETQLMKKPKAEEIEEAREEILGQLRQINATGELQFQEQ